MKLVFPLKLLDFDSVNLYFSAGKCKWCIIVY